MGGFDEVGGAKKLLGEGAANSGGGACVWGGVEVEDVEGSAAGAGVVENVPKTDLGAVLETGAPKVLPKTLGAVVNEANADFSTGTEVPNTL